jgi:hypothetical protein
MDTIADIIESLDELLAALEEMDCDDDLHLALEVGHHFRDELAASQD